jgi:acetolactate synthase-1/2/3 large subunit
MGFGLPAANRRKDSLPRPGSLADHRRRRLPETQIELQTIRQEGIKINIAVINNSFLGMVRQWQELFFD